MWGSLLAREDLPKKLDEHGVLYVRDVCANEPHGSAVRSSQCADLASYGDIARASI